MGIPFTRETSVWVSPLASLFKGRWRGKLAATVGYMRQRSAIVPPFLNGDIYAANYIINGRAPAAENFPRRAPFTHSSF